jgi:branched-chain amino acid transport system substrate-binding protein
MKFGKILKMAAAALLACAASFSSIQAQSVIKVGMSAAKTGPLAGATAVTQWPNTKLWVHNVNAKGGIKVGDRRIPVKFYEYDDRSSATEAVKNTQRMINVDKVDFIVAPLGTGINLAVAPLMARAGYPQIAVSSITTQGDRLVKRWPNMFFTAGDSTKYAQSVVNILKKMLDEGKINNRVAVVNVADAFGIELAKAGKPALKKAGFEIVYETSYPLGTQDLAPVINSAKRAKPDSFIAFSYPPDTFALTGQAKISNLDVKVFYTGVLTCFPAYYGKFGTAVEGNLGAGGVNANTAAMKAYRKQHLEVTGVDADYWCSAITYASLQMLEQAIERAGTLNRAAVIKQLHNGTFDTVMGQMTFDGNIIRKYWTVGQWQNGVFEGVASTGLDGARTVVLKTGWN